MAIETIYQLVVLAVGVLSILRGYRRGLVGQLPEVLGVAFGIVASRVLARQLITMFTDISGLQPHTAEILVLTSLLVSSVIYESVYYTVRAFTGVFKKAVKAVYDSGVLDSMAGSFFTMMKNLITLSIVYNLLLCFNPGGELLRIQNAHDGNLAGAVMGLGPALLGCYGCEELSHLLQLREAHKISCNQSGAARVIEMTWSSVRPQEIKQNAKS